MQISILFKRYPYDKIYFGFNQIDQCQSIKENGNLDGDIDDRAVV